MRFRACEQFQKFCEHDQASTHLIIASNSLIGIGALINKNTFDRGHLLEAGR